MDGRRAKSTAHSRSAFRATLKSRQFTLQIFRDAAHPFGVAGLAPEPAPVRAGGIGAALLDARLTSVVGRSIERVGWVFVSFHEMNVNSLYVVQDNNSSKGITMLKMQSYDNNHEETKPVKLPEKIESLSFSFDGGRVGVSINGEQVFYSMLGGNDCNVEIDNK